MSDKPHFDVTSAVIRQLGEQLISDEATALLELVKNAYDADATYAQVVVEVPSLAGDSNAVTNGGRIVITDNGTGMDETDIRLKWLRISVSEKRSLKRSGGVTPKYKRTPQGDKGLGRLSAQRLGTHVKVTSIKEIFPHDYPDTGSSISPTQVELDVRWDLFGEDTPLSEVPVSIVNVPRKRRTPGTTLEINNLQNADVWRGEGRDNLVTKLTQLISPFAKDRPFRVSLSVGADTFNFEKIADQVRAVALSTHRFTWDGSQLRITGKLKPGVFVQEMTNEGQTNDVYWQAIGHDEGAAFFAYLQKGRGSTVPGLQHSSHRDWFLEYDINVDIAHIPGLEYEPVPDLNDSRDTTGSRQLPDLFGEGQTELRVIDPGPFEGELDQFAYEGIDLSSIASVFNRERTYKEYVRQHAGVRIYRDGFGVRPYGLGAQDWLRLQSGQTSGRSFYGLRPNNVIGYVAISARSNPGVEDKTDREGLIDTAITRNFMRICTHAADRINGVFNTLRRKYNAYTKSMQEQMISALSPEEALSRIERLTGGSSQQHIIGPLSQVQRTIDDLRAIVETASGTPDSSDARSAVRLLMSRVGSELRALDAPVRRSTEEAKILDTATTYLRQEIASYRNQMAEFSHLAAIGLTVEAFTHNLVDIADRLHRQTAQIRSVLNRKNIVVPELLAYLEYVRGAVAELRLQLGRIAPSLKYVREVREQIHVLSYFENVRSYYLNLRHLGEEGFKFTLVEPFEDFTILMNQGKLTQVVDNLLLNSEFWLREAFRQRRLSEPHIYIQAQKPKVRIWDNGLGVDPAIETSLFDPFVTTKPRAQGRGLGLFITRQLLETEGCELYLLPERNQHGRRYIFELNLRGALDVS